MPPMTKEQLTEHIKQIIGENLNKEVKEVVEEAVAASLQPIRDQQTNWMSKILAGRNGEDEPKIKREVGHSFARCVMAVVRAKMDGYPKEKAIDVLKSWGDHDLAKQWEDTMNKALAAGDPTAGGFLVPTQFSQDIIELLRASAVVRSLQPVVIPMPTGTVRVPKITAGASASYIGENVNVTKSEPSFGQITMSFKKLASLVPISNDLIRYSSPAADGIVRDDVIRAMATREDQAFIRDQGVSATPKGLKWWIHQDNKFDANSSVSLANTTTDLGTAIQRVMAANVPLVVQQFPAGGSVQAIDVRPGWIFSPRIYRYLTTVRLTNGPYAFRDEMLRGTLWGFPFRVTTQVQEDLTGSGGVADSEVYFGGFAYAVIGESMNLVVDVSQEAAYDDSGTVRAAFSLDQTIVRVIAEHDFALRQDKAFSLIEQVTWGV